MGYPLPIVEIEDSYLRGRGLQIRTRKNMPGSRKLKVVLPQSAVFSLKLYSIYIANTRKSDIFWERTTLAMYADDNAVAATTPNDRETLTTRQAYARRTAYQTKET